MAVNWEILNRYRYDAQQLPVRRAAVRPRHPAVLPACKVLQPGDRTLHPGGHLPRGRAEPVHLLPEQPSMPCGPQRALRQGSQR